ncbi:excinuclease ABC subunit C [Tepidicaulis marinus]|uniref:Excinuclease ABC subunit C n=1 Tax=Tepidicaulis marinus TaxID=1333998 RepID=A0A081BDC3_9HYPH|nr:GIY-YIG nuclease family protein [Tepidicaulis marinus]GAK46041.1 excinuclease ABC subunit C [Tepidicaulis marinus]
MTDYYVYILANRRRGTLYVGVTNDLLRRVHEHKSEAADGFTKCYGVKQLVWFEATPDIEEAIRAEKRIKRWRRDYKIAMIEDRNPDWLDLFDELVR